MRFHGRIVREYLMHAQPMNLMSRNISGRHFSIRKMTSEYGIPRKETQQRRDCREAFELGPSSRALPLFEHYPYGIRYR